MDVIVKKSKIEGKGVFANMDFKKREIVIKWDKPLILKKEEIKNIPKKEQKFISYYKNGKYILHQTEERYVNHSCNPNTIAKNNSDVAIKDIKKGKEITGDYIKEKVPEHNLNFKCNCKSKNCKKVITGIVQNT
ncbi:MAG: SET domain-containing protein-lysine N-methyltransferase [archaeon]